MAAASGRTALMFDIHVGGRRARQQHLAADIRHRSGVLAYAVYDLPLHHTEAGDRQAGGGTKHMAIDHAHDRAAAAPPWRMLRLFEAGEHDVVTGACLLDERRDGRGWMLQVVVQAHDQIALRRPESGEERRMLAAIGSQIDDAQAIVPRGGHTQHVSARVRAAVVDCDHLVRPPLVFTHADDAVDRRADDRRAVVDGKDNGDHRT
jgi:hypothetical protein